MNKELIFGIATGAVVLSAVVLAFTVTGSPGHERALALDERRLNDVEQIARAMIPRYDHRALPRELPSDIAKSDPETGKPYEYVLVNAQKYELCVHFDEAAPERDAENWRSNHGAGRHCFAFAKNTAYPIEAP